LGCEIAHRASGCRQLTSAVKGLKDFPHSGRVGQVEGTRELVVAGVPYMVIYRVASDCVEILRAFHTSRAYPESFH
jgi:toxin ParE1/3/4